MSIMFVLTLLLSTLLPGHPSKDRGFLALDCAFVAYSFGFIIKYLLFRFWQSDNTNWLYKFIMNNNHGDAHSGSSAVMLVFVCQLAFWGFLLFGIILLLHDYSGLNVFPL